MKAFSLILLFVSSVGYAAQVSFTEHRVPFACDNVSFMAAEEDLTNQCKILGKSLSDMYIGSCTLEGEDGSYVKYFTVTVVAVCK